MTATATAAAAADTVRAVRFRRARIVIFAVVTLCLAQIGWWIYFQLREARRDVVAAVQLGDTSEHAESIRKSRERMAVAEGAFLAAALIGGVVSIYWLMGRELTREHEQNQLLAAVSHDFKTPLTSLMLAAQSIELHRGSDADRARLAQTLVANARRLEDLVDNVLAAGRLHAGKLRATFIALDLAAEVERGLAQRAPLLESRGATLVRRIAPGLSVRADPSLLQSALGNLLDNALKYSHEAPHLTVTVERDGAAAKLSVIDRGVGFEQSQALELFDRFQRGAAPADRSRPGLGLGLWLVREIVALHGGSVAAHSAGANCGATFAFTLPLLEARA